MIKLADKEGDGQVNWEGFYHFFNSLGLFYDQEDSDSNREELSSFRHIQNAGEKITDFKEINDGREPVLETQMINTSSQLDKIDNLSQFSRIDTFKPQTTITHKTQTDSSKSIKQKKIIKEKKDKKANPMMGLLFKGNGTIGGQGVETKKVVRIRDDIKGIEEEIEEKFEKGFNSDESK